MNLRATNGRPLLMGFASNRRTIDHATINHEQKMTSIDQYLTDNRTRFEEELFQLLRIPSVSGDGAYRNDVARAADWIAERFRALELETEVVQTEGNPIVLATSPPVEGRPTVLVYGHYDVQPPDPLDEWESPPFEPTVRDGNVYARGATDDKGQMFTHLASAEAWLKTAGELPVQLKFVVEGEEECGSGSLEELIARDADRLACDVIVISDCSQFAKGQPAITYGLRGIAYFELRLTGPKQDLHSGTFGGAVTNPAGALARMLAALVDNKGRVQVPEFYDDIPPLDDRERRQFAGLPFNEKALLDRLDVDGVTGEHGYSMLERRWARPSLDVNGLSSGYQGEGGKTIIPSRASAKFSFRLVPDQDPDKIAANLRGMLEEMCPAGIRMELEAMHGAPGVVVSLDSPFVGAAARAIEDGFGRSPVMIREGGSIPIVTEFCKQLGAEALLLGWGLDDDNTHSPNEKLSLADFHRGIKSSARLWHELSRIEIEPAE